MTEMIEMIFSNCTDCGHDHVDCDNGGSSHTDNMIQGTVFSTLINVEFNYTFL